MKLVDCLTVGLCSLYVSAASASQTLAAQDFAYAMPILTPAPAAAYRVPVPLEVYRKTVRDDLSDLRIFNARGEVVPYELQQPQPASPEMLTLPLYTLRGDAHVMLDGLRVSIQSQGTDLNVQSDPANASAQTVVGYVLDSRELKLPVDALELRWQEDAAEYSGSVRVESSDDLGYWRTVRSDAPVVNLHTADSRLVQGRLEIPATRAKFWRLTWIGKSAPFEVTSVMARESQDRPQTQRSSISVPGTAGIKRQEFSFDLAAQLPVSQVNIELPQSNNVARLQLLSRRQASDPWRVIAHGDFFTLRTDTADRHNDPIAIATDSDRYWLARLEQPGSDIGEGVPKLTASWNVQDIVFLARGDGPFVLAYGSSSVGAANSSLSALLTAVIVAPAQTGAAFASGGEKRLLPASRTLAWKLDILWAFLGIGVILLAWMAYRLSRELSASK